MIVATPLDLPKIEPDDWNTFWDIWHSGADFLVKTRQNTVFSKAKPKSSNVWKGMDIYSSTSQGTTWQAPFVDIQQSLPKLYETCSTLPIEGVFRVRLLTSLVPIPAHTDDDVDRWSIRAYFHYTSNKDQWYFTNPHDTLGERRYFHVPSETNWFAYNDKHCWHGTDYDPNYPKILLQVYTLAGNLQLVNSGIEKYKNYTLNI